MIIKIDGKPWTVQRITDGRCYLSRGKDKPVERVCRNYPMGSRVYIDGKWHDFCSSDGVNRTVAV